MSNVAKNVVSIKKLKTAIAVKSIFNAEVKAKSVIDVQKGAIDSVVTESIKVLAKTGLVFDHGGLAGIDLEDSIHHFESATLRLAMSQLAIFVKKTVFKGQIIDEVTDCPLFVGEIITTMTKWNGIPIVESITDHPVVTKNGRIIGAGIDDENRIFGRFEPCDFLIPESPTVDHAKAALEKIRELIQTFEFEKHGDEAATLAGFLTAVARPILPTAPLILIDAPMSGSGKGYLGDLISRCAFRKTPNSKQLPDDHAEIHKSIVSSLISAQPVIFFDELATSELDCPAIRTLATAEVYSSRVLGSMRDVHLSTKSLVICTGNNISPSADTSRRILHIRLNPMCENPSARNFKYKAHIEMAKNRNHFVSLLLTIQKAFLIAYSQGQIQMPVNVGGFDDWELMCRAPVIWLTGVDPCERMLESMRSNPAKADLLSVLMVWKDKFGSSPVSAGNALKNVAVYEAADDAVNRRPGSPLTPKGFGNWIKKHKAQITQGLSLQDGGICNGYQMWWLQID